MSPVEWDDDGFEPDDGFESDVNDAAPEVETAEEYGPIATFTEPVPAPDDVPNGAVA